MSIKPEDVEQLLAGSGLPTSSECIAFWCVELENAAAAAHANFDREKELDAAPNLDQVALEALKRIPKERGDGLPKLNIAQLKRAEILIAAVRDTAICNAEELAALMTVRDRLRVVVRKDKRFGPKIDMARLQAAMLLYWSWCDHAPTQKTRHLHSTEADGPAPFIVRALKIIRWPIGSRDDLCSQDTLKRHLARVVPTDGDFDNWPRQSMNLDEYETWYEAMNAEELAERKKLTE